MTEWLAGWYNWPFLVPLLMGLFFILIDLFVGSVTDFLGLDGSFDIDGDGDVDIDLSQGEGDGHGFSLLQWLGMGKVPISILIEVLFITWGSTGLFINAVGNDIISGWGSILTFVPALVGASIVAPFLTRMVATTITRFVPPDSTTSRSAHDFIGDLGVATSPVSSSVGQVRLPQQGGRPETNLVVKLAVEGETLPSGSQVLIVGYDTARHMHLVESAPSPIQE